MPHGRFSPIGEYWPIHINAPAAGQAAGLTARVQTTSTTAITAGPNQPFSPASLANIYLNMALLVYGGVGTPEVITVLRVDKVNNLVYANFQNNHSGTWNIKSVKGSYVGPLTVNKLGSGETITLYHGDPAVTGLAPYNGTPVAVITPAAGIPQYPFGLYLPYGLYWTYAATTNGDYTLHYLDAE